MHPETIEKQDEWSKRFARWPVNAALGGYPWVDNIHAPLTPVRRALPLLNLALISTAGGYIDGTEPFDLESKDGDLNYREMPIEVDAADIRYAAKGYDPKNIYEDRNCQVPIDRLLEYQANAVIGDSGIPTICLSVDPTVTDRVRPPRTAY